MLEDKDLLSIQEVRTKVEKAHAAWLKYRSFAQQQVDAIVERMAAAARATARELAEMAVEETGYGNVPDKYAKNLLASDLLPRRMRGLKTVGVLRELPDERVVEIGVPMGVVAAILPTTNPTSTAIYKIPHRAQIRQRHRDQPAPAGASLHLPRRGHACTRRPLKPARPSISSSAWTTPRWKPPMP